MASLAASPAAPPQPKAKVEILWDHYGVPHIFAANRTDAARGYGYAQMTNHAEQFLLNVAAARGRYAEYFGAGKDDLFAKSDMMVRTVGIAERAERWLAQGGVAQRRLVEAFVAGANAYAGRHGATIAPALRRILPIRPSDPLAVYQLAVDYRLVADRAFANAERWQAGARRAAAGGIAQFGSNGWALSPAKTASGNAILLGNPHLDLGAAVPQNGDMLPSPRQGLLQWFEAQIVVGSRDHPDMNVTGAGFVAEPFISIGFNDRLGWTHTVNAVQNADVFELAVDRGRYRFGDRMLKLERRAASIRICPPGQRRCSTRRFRIERSVHGPIIASRPGGKVLALRLAGLDAAAPAQQYWDMARAKNLAEFESAFRRLQMPYFNVIYADRDGHVLYVDAGLQPIRPRGTYDDYRGVLAGSDPSLLWTKTLAWSRLPRVLDPPGGFVQNSNDSPWTSTVPAELRRTDFPAWLSFDLMDLRPQHGTAILLAKPRLSIADVLAGKQSTRMILADRMLPDLLAAAARSTDPVVAAACAILRKWDRTADAASRGSVLFDRWRSLYVGSDAPAPNGTPTTPPDRFRVPFDPAAPLRTPMGLSRPREAVAALAEAARRTKALYGRLDVPWGEVFRVALVRRDSDYLRPRIVAEIPASGSPDYYGGMRLMKYLPADAQGVHLAAGGEGYTQLVEFTPNGAKAQILLAYGNATRPGSRHVADQLGLFAAKQLRPAWRSRADILAHLERAETLP